MALEPLIYDETTGLPKLPEGFAWKVENNEYSQFENDPETTALVVRIAKRRNKKRTWWQFLTGQKGTEYWDKYDHELSEGQRKSASDREDVKNAASNLYNTIRDTQPQVEKTRELVGLYPPKSIL